MKRKPKTRRRQQNKWTLKKNLPVIFPIIVIIVALIYVGGMIVNPAGMFRSLIPASPESGILVFKYEVYGEYVNDYQCKIIEKDFYSEDLYRIITFTQDRRRLYEILYINGEDKMRDYQYNGDPWDLSSDLIGYSDEGNTLEILELNDKFLPKLQHHKSNIINWDYLGMDDDPIEFYTGHTYTELGDSGYTLLKSFKGDSIDEVTNPSGDPVGMALIKTEDIDNMKTGSKKFMCNTHIITTKTINAIDGTITRETIDYTTNPPMKFVEIKYYDEDLNVIKKEYFSDIDGDGVYDVQYVLDYGYVQGNQDTHLSEIKHNGKTLLTFEYDFGEHWDALIGVYNSQGQEVSNSVNYNILPSSETPNYM